MIVIENIMSLLQLQLFVEKFTYYSLSIPP
jgi:hypothetical protein